MINKPKARARKAAILQFIDIEFVAQTTHVQPHRHAEVVACATQRQQDALKNESGLVLVSNEAPTFLPFVLVHFFLALLDDAGQEEFRCTGNRARHEWG